MAGSVNKVILVGNLGRDPEVRSCRDGRSTAPNVDQAAMSVRQLRKERTEWHRVVIFNEKPPRWRRSSSASGSKVYVGAVATRKWTDQSGQGALHDGGRDPALGGALTMPGWPQRGRW